MEDCDIFDIGKSIKCFKIKQEPSKLTFSFSAVIQSGHSDFERNTFSSLSDANAFISADDKTCSEISLIPTTMSPSQKWKQLKRFLLPALLFRNHVGVFPGACHGLSYFS